MGWLPCRSLPSDQSPHVLPLSLFSRQERIAGSSHKALDDDRDEDGEAGGWKPSCQRRTARAEKMGRLHEEGSDQVVDDDEQRVELRSVLFRLQVAALDVHDGLHHVDPA